MRRHLLGLIALLLIAIGTGGYFFISGRDGDRSQAAAILLRAGLLLGALWLAMPQLQTISPWVAWGVIIGGLMIAFQPKLILLVGAILVAVAILQYLARFFLPKMPTRRSTRGTPKDTR